MARKTVVRPEASKTSRVVRSRPSAKSSAAAQPKNVAASLEDLKHRLTVLKAHLEADAADIRASSVSSDFDGLVAAAQLTAQQETDDMLRDLVAQRLGALEHAAQRARQGRYGICESCGVAIPPERLQAVPHTTVCVSCQSQRERLRLRRAA